MERHALLITLSDHELLRRLDDLLASSRRSEADLVAHIGEVDARKLYAREAAPSMYAYCTERLHLSEAEAFLRIRAARAARDFPAILDMLRDGRLHLAGISRLAPVLTPDNCDELLARSAWKSKDQIVTMLADRSPKPSVPPTIRKLPERRPAPPPAPADPSGRHSELAGQARLCPDRVGVTGEPTAPPPTAPPVPVSSPPRVEPLGAERYKVQFTASAELREKLERLRGLMTSSVPDGDLAAIIDAAVSEKLERLEARRFARTNRPRKPVGQADPMPTSRSIPAPIRRAVFERDEGQCGYVDDEGRRCTERVHLEFHHRIPFGVGGGHEVSNIGLACRSHNLLHAETDYGHAVMKRHLDRRGGRRPKASST